MAYLVAHHHTYTNIDGLDYQILVETDFLVNLYEDNCDIKAIESAYNKIFKTEMSKKFVKQCFIRTNYSPYFKMEGYYD